MVSPAGLPKDLKLDTEVDLALTDSCNCMCCPIFRSRTPGKAKSSSPAEIQSDGKDTAGRKVGFWESLSAKKTNAVAKQAFGESKTDI